MEASSVVLFLATASGRPWYHREFLFGCLDASHTFNGVVGPGRCGPLLPVFKEGLYVEENRDILTAQFVDSYATHLLFIDTDIGFRANHIAALLETGRDVVSGTYCYKEEPTRRVVGEPTGKRDGDLELCRVVPGGFLLVTRGAVLRVMSKMPNDLYEVEPGRAVTAMWHSRFVPGQPCHRDDAAFSKHCRDAGLDLWMHRGVVLTHYGEKGFRPDDNLRQLRPG